MSTMPRFGVFFRFDGAVLHTTHFAELSTDYARANGWELVGWEPRSDEHLIADVREQEEHQWDPMLLAKALKHVRERRLRG